MTQEEIDTKTQDLINLHVYTSKLLARKAVLDGKYEKYRDIAVRNLANKPVKILKDNVTVWTCPSCATGFLTKRTNSKSKETFLGCSNFPKCLYTQKEEKPDDGLMGVVDAAAVWEK